MFNTYRDSSTLGPVARAPASHSRGWSYLHDQLRGNTVPPPGLYTHMTCRAQNGLISGRYPKQNKTKNRENTASSQLTSKRGRRVHMQMTTRGGGSYNCSAWIENGTLPSSPSMLTGINAFCFHNSSANKVIIPIFWMGKQGLRERRDFSNISKSSIGSQVAPASELPLLPPHWRTGNAEAAAPAGAPCARLRRGASESLSQGSSKRNLRSGGGIDMIRRSWDESVWHNVIHRTLEFIESQTKWFLLWWAAFQMLKVYGFNTNSIVTLLGWNSF